MLCCCLFAILHAMELLFLFCFSLNCFNDLIFCLYHANTVEWMVFSRLCTSFHHLNRPFHRLSFNVDLFLLALSRLLRFTFYVHRRRRRHHCQRCLFHFRLFFAVYIFYLSLLFCLIFIRLAIANM